MTDNWLPQKLLICPSSCRGGFQKTVCQIPAEFSSRMGFLQQAAHSLQPVHHMHQWQVVDVLRAAHQSYFLIVNEMVNA